MFFTKKKFPTEKELNEADVPNKSYVVCAANYGEDDSEFIEATQIIRAKTRKKAAEDFLKWYPKFESCTVYENPTTFTCTRELKVKEVT